MVQLVTCTETRMRIVHRLFLLFTEKLIVCILVVPFGLLQVYLCLLCIRKNVMVMTNLRSAQKSANVCPSFLSPCPYFLMTSVASSPTLALKSPVITVTFFCYCVVTWSSCLQNSSVSSSCFVCSSCVTSYRSC